MSEKKRQKLDEAMRGLSEITGRPARSLGDVGDVPTDAAAATGVTYVSHDPDVATPIRAESSTDMPEPMESERIADPPEPLQSTEPEEFGIDSMAPVNAASFEPQIDVASFKPEPLDAPDIDPAELRLPDEPGVPESPSPSKVDSGPQPEKEKRRNPLAAKYFQTQPFHLGGNYSQGSRAPKNQDFAYSLWTPDMRHDESKPTTSPDLWTTDMRLPKGTPHKVPDVIRFDRNYGRTGGGGAGRDDFPLGPFNEDRPDEEPGQAAEGASDALLNLLTMLTTVCTGMRDQLEDLAGRLEADAHDFDDGAL